MKVIVLNGPPRSGKDTIGGAIWKRFGGALLKFAAPIQDAMLDLFSIDMNHVEKDAPHPGLRGRTPRQVAIAYSESFCKPLFGIDFFGKLAADELRGHQGCGISLATFTDSGFVDEIRPVLAAVGKGNVLQIRLSRPGRTFQGDSRGIWDHPDVGWLEFENDSPTLKELQSKLEADLFPEIDKWLTR